MHPNLLETKLITVSRIFGFTIAFSTYYAFNYFSPQTISLVDEAIYPPQLGETLTPPSYESDEVDYEVKDPVITREKEIV
jgi:hypothetical protein